MNHTVFTLRIKLLLIATMLFTLVGCNTENDNKIIADGSYSCEVSLEGGSGKATVDSPAQVVVADGQISVTLVWSSKNYDYMIVQDEKYYNEADEGENSQFTIPIPDFDTSVNVIGDTTAMSTPHEIEYTLTVFSPGNDGSFAQATDEDSGSITTEDVSLEGLTYIGSLDLGYAKEYSVDYYKDDEGNSYNYITIGSGEFEQHFLQCCEDGSTTYSTIEVDKTYLVSTSAMDLIASIGALDNIRLSGTKREDWSVVSAQDAMDKGNLIYAGKYSAPDYELLLSEECNFAIENTMIYHTPEVYDKLQSLGITVMVERSSYEDTPLGRLEWIKLYGVLFDRLDEAQALFDEQRSRIEAISEIESTGKSVAVFSINSNGTVTIRKPGDYVSSMIELAGGTYVPRLELDKDENDLSTMNITIEDFYAGAVEADLLIYNGAIEGDVDSLEELTVKMPFLSDFKAYKNGSVYCLTEDYFQQSTHVADFIEDVHNILSENNDPLNYLYRIE